MFSHSAVTIMWDGTQDSYEAVHAGTAVWSRHTQTFSGYWLDAAHTIGAINRCVNTRYVGFTCVDADDFKTFCAGLAPYGLTV